MRHKERFVEGEAGRLSVEAACAILEEMDRQKLSKSELARRMRVTRQDVGAILDGERAMTFRTLGKFAYGLGTYFKVSIRKDARPSPSETWRGRRERRVRRLRREQVPRASPRP